MINHQVVLSPQTIANDNPASFKTKINGNCTLAQTEAQAIEDRVEDSFDGLFGSGLLTLPTVTISASSLSVSFTDFTYLIGVCLAKPAGSTAVLASQAAGKLYLCNDGTWATALPTVKSFFEFATYVSTGSGVTSFTLNTLLIPKLVTVSGTVSNINIPDSPGYADFYIDHSATAVFAIPGFITMNVDDEFSVELLYSGNITTDSDTLTSPPHNCTEKGFHYRISRRAGYYYVTNPTCNFSYVRTGMCVTT